MILLSNLLIGFAQLLQGLLSFYTIILIARIICSWVSADYYNPIVRFIYNATEPVLEKVRRYMPNFGMIDLSPIVVFLVIQLVSSVLVRSLIDYATLLKNN